MPGRQLICRISLLCCAAFLASGASALEPPPLEAYGQLPAMERVTLSPSGERFAFAANSPDQRRRLFVVSVDNQPLTMRVIGDLKLRRIAWAGERFVVVATSNTYNLGLYYGFRHELTNYQAIDLQRDGAVMPLLGGTRTLNVAFGAYGLFARDGRWYAYLGALPLSRSPLTGETYLGDVERNLVEVDLETGQQRTAVPGCDDCADWLLGPGGTLLATAEYDERSGDWRLYAGKRERLLLRTRDPLGFNAILGQGRSAGTVLYQLADAEGAIRYFERPLAGGDAHEVLADENVQALLSDPLTQLLTGFVREGDTPELVLFDTRHAARLRGTRKAFPGLSVRFDSASADLTRFIVYTQGAADGKGGVGDSGTYWLVDITSGQAKVLGEAYPRVRPAQVGPWRTVSYRAADGLPLQGVLTLPPQREPKDLPLVVLPHGGPEARDYAQFDWWAQAFASRGYAVWQPNFRGSDGFGTALRMAGDGEWGGKMQSDISDGTAELVRQKLVDPRRVCIVGGSYGGYAALAGVTLQQGLYRCAVSYAGVADLQDQLQWWKQRGGDSALRFRLRSVGARSASDAIVRERSPLQHAARADAPILLIHGKDDTVVPYTQSNLMARALRRAGKPVELLALAGEDHWLSREKTRIEMLKAAVAFVQRHNPADAPPPAQAANQGPLTQ